MRGAGRRADTGPGPLAWLGVVLLLGAGWLAGPGHAGMPHGIHDLAPRAPPPLALRDLEGMEHRLEAYRGQVLVVNFWSTWCLPCRAELPGMARTARTLAVEGVRFVTVAMGQDADEVHAYLANHPFDLPKLLDPTARAAEAWRVQGLPTSYVVDPRGRLVMQVVGALDWESPALLERLRRHAP